MFSLKSKRRSRRRLGTWDTVLHCKKIVLLFLPLKKGRSLSFLRVSNCTHSLCTKKPLCCSFKMDALQEAYFTLELLTSPCKHEQQHLQWLQVARGKTERRSKAPPSLTSTREALKKKTNTEKVMATSACNDAKTSTNKRVMILTASPARG